MMNLIILVDLFLKNEKEQTNGFWYQRTRLRYLTKDSLQSH